MRLGEKCPKVRECCVCHARASFNAKHPPAGEPFILTIFFSIYFRKNGRRIIKPCPRVAICLPCLRGTVTGDEFMARDRAVLLAEALATSALSIDALERHPAQQEGAKIA